MSADAVRHHEERPGPATSRGRGELGEPGRGERLAFATGDVFVGGATSLISVMYLIFLTDVVGLRPGLAGSVVLVAKVWDAVNDPLMGALSDRVRMRLGRRRPFMLVGGVLLIPVMAIFWMPEVPPTSQVGMFAWAAGSYVLYATVQTIIAVPYSSLSTEIATDYDVRNRTNTLRLLLSTVSSAACTLLAGALFESYRAGGIGIGTLYVVVVAGFGGIFVLTVMLSATCARERTPLPTTHEPLSARAFVAPLRSGSFRRLLGMYLSHSLALDVITTSLLYYTLYVVTGASSQVVLGTFIAVNVVAYPVVTWLVGRVDKRAIYRTLLPVAMLGALGVALYPGSWPTVGLYAVAAAVAIGMSGAQLMPWVMFGDVIDDAERTTGRRPAGSFTGVMTFTRGLASALVVQTIGLVLDVTGYVAPVGEEDVIQSAQTQTGIRLVIGIGIVAMLAVGWFVSRAYPIDRLRALATADELVRRRSAGTTEEVP